MKKKKITIGMLTMSTLLFSGALAVSANSEESTMKASQKLSEDITISTIQKNEDGSITVNLNKDPGNGVFIINSGSNETNIANSSTSELNIRASYVNQLDFSNEFYIQHISWDTSLIETVLNIKNDLMNTALNDKLDIPLIESNTPLTFSSISIDDRSLKGFADPNSTIQMTIKGNLAGITQTNELGNFEITILPNVNLEKIKDFSLKATNSDGTIEIINITL